MMTNDLQGKNEDFTLDFDIQCNDIEKELKQDEVEEYFEEQNDDSDQQQDTMSGTGDSPKYIRLRGLPWSARHQEILDFLKNINVVNGSNGIHLVTSRWDGKNTGEAYVEVQGTQDVEEARKLNKALMGHRYIEVFAATSKDAKEAMRKTGTHGMSFVVKLRGLPYAITESQVEEFFQGLEIKAEREGILFVTDKRGRATGEAFVQFENQEDTEQALGRNREKIGHRYIEIFRSSLAELKRAASGNGRPGPYDLKDRGGYRNDYGRNMRGGEWGHGYGMGANNTLGFNNLHGLINNGFPNGMNNGGNFVGNNRFSNGNQFKNDFGDFNNFGNNRNFHHGVHSDYSNNMRGGNFNSFGNGFNSGGNMGSFSGNNIGSNFGPIGGGRGDSEYFTIHMRGLPYTSYENDVFKFFDPIRPANVRINFNKKGLHNGTADAYFDTYDDAQLAMKRHREQMGSRYIELFFDGKTKGNANFSRRI